MYSEMLKYWWISSLVEATLFFVGTDPSARAPITIVRRLRGHRRTAD
jgi:hypothetical protein